MWKQAAFLGDYSCIIYDSIPLEQMYPFFIQYIQLNFESFAWSMDMVKMEEYFKPMVFTRNVFLLSLDQLIYICPHSTSFFKQSISIYDQHSNLLRTKSFQLLAMLHSGQI